MSSKRWLQEHHSDIYVKKSRQEGYASRAAYKLLELNEKDKFLKPGMTVVDLGAAPGGWAKVASELVASKGKVIAMDILPMNPIEGVVFIQGDFTEQSVFEAMLSSVGIVHLVMSDMSPNTTGNKSIDQPRSLYLVELALDFACSVLKLEGVFVSKIFQGAGMDAVIAKTRQYFSSVKLRKPNASRSRSSEVYIVASGFLGYNGRIY